MSEFDVFLADCPARTTLDLVADTWSVVVVFGLGHGPQRYSDLRERIGGISKKIDWIRRCSTTAAWWCRTAVTIPRRST